MACADSAVILQANHEAPNSGLFFIRNFPWPFHFLDEVYRQEQFIHHPCWENVAIIELLNKEAVREDLRLWYPKVRSGSVFAGHNPLDSNPPDFHFGVRRAVLEFERQRGVRAPVTTECDWPSWYLIKP